MLNPVVAHGRVLMAIPGLILFWITVFWVAAFLVTLATCGHCNADEVKVMKPSVSLTQSASGDTILTISTTPSASRVIIQRRSQGTGFRTIGKRAWSPGAQSVSWTDEFTPKSAAVYRVRTVVLGYGMSPWSSPVTLDPGRPPASKSKRCPPAVVEDSIDQLNSIRAVSGLQALLQSQELELAAQRHSMRMARNGVLSHEGWFEEILNSGFSGSGMSQNIASGYTSMAAVLAAWLESPGHQSNMLHPSWTDTGFGCVVDHTGRTWWTNNFGRR